MPVSDDSIVYYLDLVDRTKAVADAAFLRLQKQMGSAAGVRAGSELDVQRSKVAQMKLDHQSLKSQGLLTKELEAQRALRAGLRDPLGKISGGVRGRMILRDFDDLRRSFLTLEGMKARTISLFGGQIGSLMAYFAAVKGVSMVVKELVGSQAKLQEKQAQLSIVLDSAAGEQVRDLGRLTAAARTWSKAHGQAVFDVVGGMYELGAAGRTAEQIFAEMPAVLLLAQGGLLDIGAAAEIVTTQVNTFAREGISAFGVANIIQQTAADTQVRVEDLGVALKYSAASAVTAGLSFTELNAVLGTLGNLGLRGSTAGTGLNRVFVALASQRSEIRELGVEIEDANGQLKPFIEVLEEFRRVFGASISMPEKELLTKIFDIRGARVMERLLSDTQTLQRVTSSLADSQGAVFAAAEQGANNLKEAWQVLLNQMRDVLLMQGQVAGGLQGMFDQWSGRLGKRAAADIGSSAAGARYQLEKFDELLQTNPAALREWIAELSRGAETLENEFGRTLLSTRTQLDEMTSGSAVTGPLFTALGLDVSLRPWLAKLRITDKWLATLRDALAELERIKRQEESMAQGGRILAEVFGVTGATTPLPTDMIQDYVSQGQAGLEWLARVQLEYATAMQRMQSGVVGPLQPDLMVKAWEEALAKVEGDVDAAAALSRRKMAEVLEEQGIAVLRAEVDVLEALAGIGVESQRRLVAERLKLNLLAIDKELEAEKKKNDERRRDSSISGADIFQMEYLLEQEAERKRTALTAAANRERRNIAIADLRKRYDLTSQIADLETRITLERMDERGRIGFEMQAALENYKRYAAQLQTEVDAGALTPEERTRQMTRAFLQMRVEAFGAQRAIRNRGAAAVGLEQDLVVEQAKGLLAQSAAEDNFQFERIVAHAEYVRDKAGIEADYFDDKDLREAALLVLEQRYANRRKDIYADETQFRKQVTLDSLNEIAGGLTGIARLVAVTSGEMKARLLEDLASTAQAAGGILQTLERMKLGTVSSLAGWVGIVGLVAGVAAQIFAPRRRAEQREARELADEFRHMEGRNVSAEFGRAQVYNVRIEQNNSIDFLAAPTRQQIMEMLRQMKEPLVDLLEEMGFESSGGR